jgi:hypothetical protein
MPEDQTSASCGVTSYTHQGVFRASEGTGILSAKDQNMSGLKQIVLRGYYRTTNIDRVMGYDSYLGRWVELSDRFTTLILHRGTVSSACVGGNENITMVRVYTTGPMWDGKYELILGF